jgi:hypothetical protein
MSPRDTLMTDAIRNPLPGLCRQLEGEFGDVLSKQTIDAAAEHALGELEGARIREYVPVFAWRHARARLSGRRLIVAAGVIARPPRDPSRPERHSRAPSPRASAGSRP